MNLLCTERLPGTEHLDIDHLLDRIDTWAARVRIETARHAGQFHMNPGDYENSEPYFRMLTLVTVLHLDCGVRYNPAWRERRNIEGASRGMHSEPDEYYRRWPNKVTVQQVEDYRLLRSYEPHEDLAQFLSTRSSCLEENGRTEEAIRAANAAHKRDPLNVNYAVQQNILENMQRKKRGHPPLPPINRMAPPDFIGGISSLPDGGIHVKPADRAAFVLTANDLRRGEPAKLIAQQLALPHRVPHRKPKRNPIYCPDPWHELRSRPPR